MAASRKQSEWDRAKTRPKSEYRERAYTARLEAQVHREREVVEIAGYWHHARGMHRAPWLNRLRDAVVAMEEAHE